MKSLPHRVIALPDGHTTTFLQVQLEVSTSRITNAMAEDDKTVCQGLNAVNRRSTPNASYRTKLSGEPNKAISGAQA